MGFRRYGYLRNLWCALLHHRSKRWTRLYGAWRFDCGHCGNVGVVDDDGFHDHYEARTEGGV